jgi:phospholipase D1/2
VKSSESSFNDRWLLTPYSGGSCDVQIVRSVGPWSVGTHVEDSVHSAYLDVLRAAKHYIYIENQFLISDFGGALGPPTPADADAKNEIGIAIIARLREAIREERRFRVIFVTPEFPEGNIGDDAQTQVLFGFQQRCLRAGPASLMNQLSREFPAVDLTEYVAMFSLRAVGVRGMVWCGGYE